MMSQQQQHDSIKGSGTGVRAAHSADAACCVSHLPLLLPCRMSDTEQLDYEGDEYYDGERDASEQQAEFEAEAAADLPGSPAAEDGTHHAEEDKPEVPQGSPAASVTVSPTVSASSSDSDAGPEEGQPAETRELIPRVYESTARIGARQPLFPATPQTGSEDMLMHPSPFAPVGEPSLPLTQESDITEALRRMSTHALLAKTHSRYIQTPEQESAVLQWEMEGTRAVLQAAQRLHIYSQRQQRSVSARLLTLDQSSSQSFCVVHGATTHLTTCCRTVQTFAGRQEMADLLYANPAENERNTRAILTRERLHPYGHRRRGARRRGYNNLGARQAPAAAAAAHSVHPNLQLSNPAVAAAAAIPAVSEQQSPMLRHSHQQQSQLAVMPPSPGLQPIRTSVGGGLSTALQSRLGMQQPHQPQQHPLTQHQPMMQLPMAQHCQQPHQPQQHPLTQHQPGTLQLPMAQHQQQPQHSLAQHQPALSHVHLLGSSFPAAATAVPAGLVPVGAFKELLDVCSDKLITIVDAAAAKVAAADHRAYVSRKDADFRVWKMHREQRSVFDRVQQ